MRVNTFDFEFVEYIPDKINDSIVYISIPYTTVIHKCACGCGNEVVTPLSPADWSLIFDGESISLSPSIGNWSFPCKSHYWIKNNGVKWAPKWSKEEIEAGRYRDKVLRESYYTTTKDPIDSILSNKKKNRSLWTKIKKWFF